MSSTDTQSQPPRWRAAIYVRTATSDDDVPELAAEQQLEACRALAQTQGNDVVLEIIDRNASGLNLRRPGLTRLRQSIKRREVNMVIVARLDRLSCRLTDMLVLWDEFDRRGVDLCMVRPVKLEPNESLRKMFGSIKAVIARLEQGVLEG